MKTSNIHLHQSPQGMTRCKLVQTSVPGALPARLGAIALEAEQERTRWDPKDGELCLSRTCL